MSYVLTDTDLKQLQRLNDDVSKAIAKRKTWLDAMTIRCADVKVGEMLYEVPTGRALGVVSKVYRGAPNDLYDTYVSVNYQYETSNNCFDNTSSRYIWAGTKQQAIDYADRRLNALTQS